MQPMDYSAFFQQRLSQLRLKKNVSARDMSLSLGQSPNYINSIENGKYLPSMEAFFAICTYLGVTPGEFFEAGDPDPARIAALNGALKKCSEKQLSAVEAVLKVFVPQP